MDRSETAAIMMISTRPSRVQSAFFASSRDAGERMVKNDAFGFASNVQEASVAVAKDLPSTPSLDTLIDHVSAGAKNQMKPKSVSPLPALRKRTLTTFALSVLVMITLIGIQLPRCVLKYGTMETWPLPPR